MAGQKAAADSKVSKKEWALFRLTDEGLVRCRKNPFPEDIVSLKIGDKPAVEEVTRYSDLSDAFRAKSSLSSEERARTLVQSVSPKQC